MATLPLKYYWLLQKDCLKPVCQEALNILKKSKTSKQET